MYLNISFMNSLNLTLDKIMKFSRVVKNVHSINFSKLFKENVRHKCDEFDLKKVMKEIIPKEQERIKKIRKEHDNVKLGDITLKTLYSGLRGLLLLPYETSFLDYEKGIRFRGYTIPELVKCLPRADGGEQPLPEGVFWLMCTGELPNEEQVDFLSKEWAKRGALPGYVIKMIDGFPKKLHPMAQFSAATIALNMDSKFSAAFGKGAKRQTYWDSSYDDAMNLIAKITTIAARIYVNIWKDGKHGKQDYDADWTLNFMKMAGLDCDEEFVELMRLYMTIHSDHTGGNVSAHTVHLVGSTLADPYLAYAAGMCGLAGPLHGLANQMVLQFMEDIIKKIGAKPTDDQLKEYLKATLKSGQVIPGYGHAALRVVDPRFKVLTEFGQKHMADDELVILTQQLFKLVPPILKEMGKAQNPWPNVDAGSGVLLYKYGMTQKSFYTVLFAVSRALGVMASLIWDRALALPIERPRSATSAGIEELAISIKKKQAK